MTDNDIIKALELCIDDECRCGECPYFGIASDGVSCGKEHGVDLLNLINRQKAEIESNKAKIKISAECIARQDKEIESKNDLIHRQSDVISEQKEKLESIYSEAIKEFANKVIDLIYEADDINSVSEWQIRNLVKEMTVEE